MIKVIYVLIDEVKCIFEGDLFCYIDYKVDDEIG